VVVLELVCHRTIEAAFRSCNCAFAKSAAAQLHEIDEKRLGSGNFR